MRVGIAIALAGLTAGCFQPLYGERTFTGGSVSMGEALAAVEVEQIEAPPGDPKARMAVELRNELTFALNGTGRSVSPTHRLRVVINNSNSALIVDPLTARSEYDIVRLDATYTLIELKTAKTVFTSSATANTSYNAPGQQQRYAMLRGQRDGQTRATKVISEQIRNRLASHFAAGT